MTGWHSENPEGIAIGWMQGREKMIRGSSDVALGAFCRIRENGPEPERALGAHRMQCFLRGLEKWFSHQLPRIFSYLSFEIVKCYWRELIREHLGEWRGGQELPVEFVLFFFYRGHYLSCSSGDIHVTEYDYQEKKFKTWADSRERQQFAAELGEEGESVFFKIRKVQKASCFIIYPGEFIPEIPKKILKRKKSETEVYLAACCVPEKRDFLCGEGRKT